jgi:hypothetical protein
MADISLQLLDSESFFAPSVTGGEIVSVAFFEEEFTFFENYITANGSVSGHPVLIEYLPSGVVFLPLVSYPQEIETQIIDQSEVYDVIRTELSFSPNLIDSANFYDISSVFGRAASLDLLDSFEIFNPTITGRQISPNIINSFEVYPIIPRVDIRLLEFSDFSFFPSSTDFRNEIITEVLEGEFYDPEVSPGNVDINVSGFIDNLYIYPLRVRGDIIDPIRFKRADTIYGGDITKDYLASSQNYYPRLPSSTYESRADFSYSPVVGLMDRYIPSSDALFSKTFYRAFYISNDSTFLERRNIDFWVDGGSTYTIDDKKIFENRFFLEDEESRYGVLLDNRDEIITDGRSKTSMFNQISVSYLFSPVRNVSNFNSDGSGVGIDLRSQTFTPGNTVTRIPVLAPGDYVGVYLKINTNFLPDFPIKSDYSFFHLSYTTVSSEFRETYPGQLKKNNVPVNQLLPSVYMRVTTDYEALKKYLEEDVEFIYSKYPPYFLSLEDIGRSK